MAQRQRRVRGAQRGRALLGETGGLQALGVAVVVAEDEWSLAGAVAGPRRSDGGRAKRPDGRPSPRQMMVSPAPTRSLHRASRCRFISSMLRNGRFQTSRIERSAKCRSGQIQVLAGGVAMIGIAVPRIARASCVSAPATMPVSAGSSSRRSVSQGSRSASGSGGSDSGRYVQRLERGN